MAYTDGNLVLWAHGNGKKLFRYDSSTDAMATVNTAGYFNNTDDDIIMAVGDLIYVKASDSTAVLEVASLSSGAVTTSLIGGVGAEETVAGSTATVAIAATGLTNLTSTAAQTVALGGPVAGAKKSIIKTGGSTAIITVNSGSTDITFDGTNQNLTFDAANESVILEGISATRWGIMSNTGSVGAS